MRLGSELVNKRSRFTKHFPVLDDVGYPIPNKFVASINSASQHYQDQTEWKDIDLTLKPCSLTNWRWEIQKNNWSLLIGENEKEGAIAAVNRADGIGIGWRPERVAYLNIVTKEWQIFKEATYSIPDVLVDEKRQVHLKWSSVWPNVDIELKVWADGIKQNILFSQAARDNAPPIPDGWQAQDTYLVWVYEVDWKKIHRIEQEDGSEIDKDEAEIDGRIIFKNALNEFSQMMPRIGAWVEDYEDEVVPIRRRLIKYQGKHYILEGCPVTKLNQLPQGTIVFDDNVTYEGAGDGYVKNVGTNYATIHDAATGSAAAALSDYVGQRLVGADYTIYRLFMYFDTSGLPDGASIDEGTKVQLRCCTDISDTDFDVCTLKGTQGTTLEVEDYDAWDSETEGTARWNSENFVSDTYIDLSLNATGRGWIDKAGNTYFCFRSLEDLGDGDAPTNGESVRFYASNVSNKDPLLYVVYSVGGEEILLTATCSVTSSTTSSLTLGKIESLTAASATAINIPSTTLQLLYSITAHAPPATLTAGNLSIVKSLAGTSSIASSTQGSLTVGRVEALTATSVATSIASGSLILGKIETLSSTAEASTSVNGSLTVLRIIFLSGTASIGSSNQGFLTLYKAFSALAEVSSETLATLSVIFRCTAIINISTSTLAKLFLLIERLERPEGVWQKQDRPTGVWSKMESPEGVWEKQDKPADGAIKQETPSGTFEKQKIPFD